ncbi:MAG: FtsX-like permease family protein [Bacteroidales bacterium]|nr:FtsX-like permease family protein [Bacteroidales bacterium]
MPKKDTTTQRRLTASYLTSLVSITLVLLLLGLIGALLLNSRKLSEYVKEHIGFSVFLQNDAREVDILNLQKTLDAKNYVKETSYITKEQAAEDFQKELGEDFVEFLGYNPLPSSIDVKLHASYANPDSITIIEEEIRSFEQVADVAYQKDLIYAVNTNIHKISLAILTFSILLLLISITLINNTIRLSIYSKRFIIRTMQLVGAQSGYIRRPFLLKGIIQGMIAALIAFLILFFILYFAEKQIEGMFNFLDYKILIILFVAILAIGIIIALFSSLLSVNKYLHIKTDNLYT